MVSKGWIIAAVGCGTFMATLDSSIVNIALPTLTTHFHTTFGNTAWISTVYHLMITCSLLPLGAISDQFGKKRVYQFGFFVFIVASMFCGLAQSLGYLIIARILQGLGGAMLMANGPAIITAFIPKENRGIALGTLGMVVSLGLAIGPSLGAPLVQLLGWRSIFWINVPVGILGLYLTQRAIGKDPSPYFKKAKYFDWMGSVLQALALISFLSLFEGSEGSEDRRPILIGVCLVTSILFGWWNHHSQNPILDLSILKNRTFSTSNLASFLSFIGYSSVVILFPFYFEDVMKLSVSESGRLMTVIPITIFIVAPISGRLSDRLGSKGLSVSGTLLAGITLIVSAGIFGPGLNEHSIYWQITLVLCCMGIANGLFQAPNNNAIMSSAPLDKLGSASAFLATVRNLGIATGTSLATSLFDSHYIKTGDATSALHFALGFASIGSFGAMIASFGKEKRCG